jgi:hypothetical protein
MTTNAKDTFRQWGLIVGLIANLVVSLGGIISASMRAGALENAVTELVQWRKSVDTTDSRQSETLAAGKASREALTRDVAEMKADNTAAHDKIMAGLEKLGEKLDRHMEQGPKATAMTPSRTGGT